MEFAKEEVLIPFPVARASIQPPTNIRSTLVASSLRSLRDRGLLEPYLAKLDRARHDAIVNAVAGVWLPLELGLAHYQACDALPLTLSEQLAIGREVGDRIHGTFLGTMIRATRSAGVTPWVAFSNTRRLYDRLFDGGACCVVKTGPKDVRMELAGNPVVGIPYFRTAIRGLWQVALELFCQRAYVLEAGRTDTSYKVKISWV